MSAFMFRASEESIRNATDDDLTATQKRLEDTLKDVQWDKLKQCTFDFDVAHGQRATLSMVKREIELRASGRQDEPLGTAEVPGYNP